MSRTKLSFLLILILIVFSANSCLKKVDETQVQRVKFGLVIHGGAGSIKHGSFTKEQEKKYRAKLTEALQKGYGILEKGGSSVDAVETAIRVMEDSPLFNAGKGAVFTNAGTNELDASIMDGKTLNAGGVAGVKHIKNPITLARFVMEHSPHVLMYGAGAEQFAKSMGINLVDTSYFFTKSRWESLQRVKMKLKEKKQSSLETGFHKFGTVGCVALDKNGNLAAGTSTGGMTNKMYGRIGDSPIIGAGTYAKNSTCAISSTGHGEFFIRNVVAYDISARMEYLKSSLQTAAKQVILKKLVAQKAAGGVIGIDKFGDITMTFNTDGMFRGYYLQGKTPVVKMYKDD